MKKINTVLGEINIDELGETLCHEHVVCVNPAFSTAFGDKWFDRAKITHRAVELLKQAKTLCGVSTVIDGTPIDQGRDVSLIKTVAEKSGVNIIISSGVHCTEEEFLRGKKPEKLASYFIDECKNGVKGTAIKPGILKCATGKRGVTEINQILLKTMSITQRETGLPLFCHNEHLYKTAYDQIEIFKDQGVDLKKVIIGHCSDTSDIKYLTDVLNNGCYVGFDRVWHGGYLEQAETIAKLLNFGYENQILVSHDYFAFYDYGDDDLETQKKWGRDFTAVHQLLFPALKNLGVKESQLKKLTVDNPKKILT